MICEVLEQSLPHRWGVFRQALNARRRSGRLIASVQIPCTQALRLMSDSIPSRFSAGRGEKPLAPYFYPPGSEPPSGYSTL